MILQVQHETKLEYSAPVSEWVAEVRMEPLCDEFQSCHTFHFNVSQPASLFRYLDGFGNSVHHFNLLAPYTQVRMLAASVVVTERQLPDIYRSQSRLPIALAEMPPDMFTYLAMRGPIRRSAPLQGVLSTLSPVENIRLVDWILGVRAFIHERFQYARAVTHVSSPIDDLLSHGKGVCQDFAHLMIGVLRCFTVPARYVSGYIHRPNKESESHAWCEAWVPDLGWVGFDPTNNCLVDDHFVKVAVGRDFTDVTPNKGIYRGNGEETMWVRVETQELPRVPSTAWRENLPPLDVPLTAVNGRPIRLTSSPDQQQQQQQQ